MEASRPQVRVPETRCPYCHDGIPRGVEPVVCPECHAAHHEECLREHGRCATCEAEHPRFGARLAPTLTLPRLRAAPWLRWIPNVIAALTMLVAGIASVDGALRGSSDVVLAFLILGGASISQACMVLFGKKVRAPGRFAFLFLWVGLAVMLFPFTGAHPLAYHLGASIISGLALISLAGGAGGLEWLLSPEREGQGKASVK